MINFIFDIRNEKCPPNLNRQQGWLGTPFVHRKQSFNRYFCGNGLIDMLFEYISKIHLGNFFIGNGVSLFHYILLYSYNGIST